MEYTIERYPIFCLNETQNTFDKESSISAIYLKSEIRPHTSYVTENFLLGGKRRTISLAEQCLASFKSFKEDFPAPLLRVEG